MIWNRADLKARGKQAVYRNYWSAVLVALVMMFFSGGFNAQTNTARQWTDRERNTNSFYEYYEEDDYYYYEDDDYDEEDNQYSGGLFNSVENFASNTMGMVMSMFVLVIVGVGLLFQIFLGNPLMTGGNRFFLENREFQSKSGTLAYMFKEGRYGNVVKTMFLRQLYITLWSFLFIVPGVIKSYEYRMIPYLLAENPHMNDQRAFELSRQMMYGHKMDAFILDLSFIGWNILSIFTCGLLSIFYVSPYIIATDAELYAVLRTYGFKMGYLNTIELPGVVSQTYQSM